MTLDKIVEKEFKKESKKSNGVAVENLIVDEQFKEELLRFSERRDYHNPDYWNDKKRVMKEYRRQVVEHLMYEYGWPKYIAEKTANVVRIPRNKRSIGDVAVAYFIANMPKRYLGPVAKLMGTDIKFYTALNIVFDVAFLGVAAYLVNTMQPYDAHFIDKIFDFSNHATTVLGTATDILFKANFLVRALQIPIRTAYLCFGKHTWSPASLITPVIPELLGMGILIGYDQKQNYKERKMRRNNYKKDNYKNLSDTTIHKS